MKVEKKSKYLYIMEKKYNVKNIYEKYWNNLLTIIKNNENNDLNALWHKIVEYELKFNGNIKIYKYCKEYTINSIDEGYNFSRKPLLDLVNSNAFDAIMEFGSGWGRNLFYLMLKNAPRNIDYYAFELTNSGIMITDILKKKIPEYQIFTKTFDINNDEINLEKKYNNVLICTFWAIEQITVLNKNFFIHLLDKFDKITGIHIEPIGWQIDEKVRKNISQENRNLSLKSTYYNTNLFSIFQELEKDGMIKIKKIEIDFFNFRKKNTAGTLIIWEKI